MDNSIKLTDEDFMRVVSYVKDRYGINLIKKRMLIEGRLYFIVTTEGYNSYKQYLDNLFKDPDSKEMTEFINRITTNHTFFMREKQHFDFLNQVFLPEMERKNKDKDIRIWSAGCSFGHEPYNIAMCIDQYFGNKKLLWDSKILATDISHKALAFAKEGIYTKDVISELPEQWQTKYFNDIGNNLYKVSPELRKEVVYKEFNLMNDITPKKPFDLIFCRNVMIYFDTLTKDSLINRFYGALKPGGYLFIGHAESMAKETKFKQVVPAVFQK